MTTELGTTSLAQARLARGLTLEDAERSTRISRKFLVALEEHNYSVFPAPIYARGFLRTYCRYLGVDPEPQLAELPAGWTESHVTAAQLAPVSTRQPITINFAWIIAGALLAAVIGLGIFLSRDSGNLGTLEQQQANQGEQQSGGVAAATDTGATGAEGQPTVQPTQAGQATTAVEQRALDPGLPGVLPDFESVAIEDVTGFLAQQDIPYLQVDRASSSVPEGLVISQSPEAGSDTADIEQVTLTVSTGSSSPALTNRTDCDVLEAANQRTAAEQAFFERSCETDAPAQALPDRTSCEEIRGTDYRSPAERTFFLTYCIVQ